MHNLEKLTVFVLKVGTSGPIETFYERNAVTTVPDLSYGTVPGAPLSDSKTLFGLHLYLVGRFCENLQSARGPPRCQPARAITWLV